MLWSVQGPHWYLALRAASEWIQGPTSPAPLTPLYSSGGGSEDKSGGGTGVGCSDPPPKGPQGGRESLLKKETPSEKLHLKLADRTRTIVSNTNEAHSGQVRCTCCAGPAAITVFCPPKPVYGVTAWHSTSVPNVALPRRGSPKAGDAPARQPPLGMG